MQLLNQKLLRFYNSINKDIDVLARKLENSAKFQGLITFITSVIPSFSKMSAIAKDRIGRCFKERHFLPGDYIIREGDPCNRNAVSAQNPEFGLSRMHLIMSGDVLLRSSKSPIELDYNNGGEFIRKEENRVMTKKGYISETINTFQIGIKSEKQWVGEESLVVDQGIYLYSVIAKNKVSTLEIFTNDFKTKFPRDYVAKMMSKDI